MKKIKLLVNHNGAKKGSVHDVENGAAEYLVKTEIAELATSVKVKSKKTVKSEEK